MPHFVIPRKPEELEREGSDARLRVSTTFPAEMGEEEATKFAEEAHYALLENDALFVAVDQEGGRVQRCREGLTRLPPAARFGQLARRHPQHARQAAEAVGWLMAAELRVLGVDFSFAPVLDLYSGQSRIINDRAFHADPHLVARLAQAYVRGMHTAGMAAVGKHFPGHGSVVADSHHELPVDRRSLDTLRLRDLVPFRVLAASGIEGLMPAHILYPAVDDVPAGYSERWLQQILRQELGFRGAIFSDDLGMSGAVINHDGGASSHVERARRALAAGCDMCLICNDRPAAHAVMGRLGQPATPLAQSRLMRMHGRRLAGEPPPQRHPRRTAALSALDRLATGAPTLPLGDDAPA